MKHVVIKDKRTNIFGSLKKKKSCYEIGETDYFIIKNVFVLWFSR